MSPPAGHRLLRMAPPRGSVRLRLRGLDPKARDTFTEWELDGGKHYLPTGSNLNFCPPTMNPPLPTFGKTA